MAADGTKMSALALDFAACSGAALEAGFWAAALLASARFLAAVFQSFWCVPEFFLPFLVVLAFFPKPRADFPRGGFAIGSTASRQCSGCCQTAAWR